MAIFKNIIDKIASIDMIVYCCCCLGWKERGVDIHKEELERGVEREREGEREK